MIEHDWEEAQRIGRLNVHDRIRDLVKSLNTPRRTPEPTPNCGPVRNHKKGRKARYAPAYSSVRGK